MELLPNSVAEREVNSDAEFPAKAENLVDSGAEEDPNA